MFITLRGIFFICFFLGCYPHAWAKTFVDHPMYPSLSPDGSTIVFSWRGDLWKVSSNGGLASRLINHPGRDYRSSWSRNGKQIAFESLRDGVQNLYLMNADGSRLQRVTKTNQSCALIGFGIDENGREALIFSSQTKSGRDSSIQHYAVTLQDGAVRPFHDGYGESPSINPDGVWVAFTGEGAEGTRSRSHKTESSDIWLFNRKKNEFLQVTQWKGNDSQAKWGDKQTLYFLSGRKFNCVNLYKTTIGGALKRITSFTKNGIQDYDISSAGNRAVMVVGQTLYTLDLRDQNAKPQPLKIYVNEGVEVKYHVGNVNLTVKNRRFLGKKAFPYRIKMRKNRTANNGRSSNSILKKQPIEIKNAPAASPKKPRYHSRPKPNVSQQYRKSYDTGNYRDRFESGNYRKNWASIRSKKRRTQMAPQLTNREDLLEYSTQEIENKSDQKTQIQISQEKPSKPLWNQGYKWLPPKPLTSNQPLRIAKSPTPLSGQYAATLTIESASEEEQPETPQISINWDQLDTPKTTHESVVDLTQDISSANTSAEKSDTIPNDKDTIGQTGHEQTLSPVQKLIRSGDTMFEQSLYKKAVIEYQSAMIHTPQDTNITIRAALSQFAARQYSKAGGTLKKALGNKPDYERLTKIASELYSSPKIFNAHLTQFSHRKKLLDDSNIKYLENALSKVKTLE